MTRSKAKHQDTAVAAVLRTLEREHGCKVVKSRHWKVYRPDGTFMLSVSGTSRDVHAGHQLTRDLRRYHGIEVG